MKDKTTENSNLIFGMMSPEGEIVPFIKSFNSKGNVENWLDTL